MKRTIAFLTVSILIFALTGCGNGADSRSAAGGESAVDKVINEQIQGSSEPANLLAQSPVATEIPQVAADYDLTDMTGDMVYALVYQMMVDPDAYIGKTFRMDGLYYAAYYEPTAQYYHYCIIQDATACCAQGLEFVWGDGSHAYPDEYPAEDAQIVVQGTFETYQDEGDENLYCRLSNATLEMSAN